MEVNGVVLVEGAYLYRSSTTAASHYYPEYDVVLLQGMYLYIPSTSAVIAIQCITLESTYKVYTEV